MRKAILMMLVTVVSGGAAAEWVKIGTSHTQEHGYRFAYVDPSTIHKSGDMMRMLDMFDYEEAHHFFKPAGEAQRYLSQKGQSEYDCKSKRWRRLDFSLHSGNLAKGNVVYASNGTPGPWLPASAGTVFEARLIFACGI